MKMSKNLYKVDPLDSLTNAEKKKAYAKIKGLGWKYRDFRDKRAANMAKGKIEKKIAVQLQVTEYAYVSLF